MTYFSECRISDKLKKLCPILKDLKIRVGNSFDIGLDDLRVGPHDYAFENIMGDLKRFTLYPKELETKITIETRPNSTYQFKKTEKSLWDSYEDRTHPDCDGDLELGNIKFDDDDFVRDTYYTIVDAKDITRFIRYSGEMINGEDRIDPLGDGKFHAAKVYVISKEVLPRGLGELIEMKKKSRNMTLYLILNKECTKEVTRRFKSMDYGKKHHLDRREVF